MAVFILYKKTSKIESINPKTGEKYHLKYLGKFTVRNVNPVKQDVHKYKGSGRRWKAHFRKYGYDVVTEIIGQYDTEEEFIEAGRYYSELWSVVEDYQWANLKTEEGPGGIPSPETRARMSISQRGTKKHTEEWKQKMSVRFTGRKFPDAIIAKIAASNTGKKRSDEARANISAAHVGYVMPEEQKQRISEALKGKQKPENYGDNFRSTLRKKKEGYKVKLVTMFGETKNKFDWELDPRRAVAWKNFEKRLKKGWDAEKAFSTPRIDREKRGPYKNRICSVDDCDRKHHSKGFCKIHYDRDYHSRIKHDIVASSNLQEAD